jgi:hypothetical protein
LPPKPIGGPLALPVLWDLEAGGNPVDRRNTITAIQRIMSNEIEPAQPDAFVDSHFGTALRVELELPLS